MYRTSDTPAACVENSGAPWRWPKHVRALINNTVQRVAVQHYVWNTVARKMYSSNKIVVKFLSVVNRIMFGARVLLVTWWHNRRTFQLLTSCCTVVFNPETLNICNNNNLFYFIISLEPDDGPLAPKHIVVSSISLLWHPRVCEEDFWVVQ